jgi:hypothetical protein|tara:strand:+ start:2554 stop:3012 length:459 start_codon:yes stop_codon:yes gene_type:complete
MAKISNTSAYPNITNIDAADYLIITDAENNLLTKTATIGQVSSLMSLPYTSYVATFTQSGTGDPVVNELYNTTEKTFSWSRNTQGVYDITPSASYKAGRVWWVISGRGGSPQNQVFGKYVGVAFSRFEQIDTTDGSFQDSIDDGHVEIRIYL